MKKDWNVIRKILLSLQQAPMLSKVLRSEHSEPHGPLVVAYNLNLLAEAGFIETAIQEDPTGNGGIDAAIALRLNHLGHELFDIVHSDQIWNRIVDAFHEQGLEMTFEEMMHLGKQISNDGRPG